MNIDDRVTRLWDQLVAHPKGVTRAEIAAEQECGHTLAGKIIQKLRDLLGSGDTIAVSCDPNPADPGGPWLYTLQGTPDGTRWWCANRIGDSERRIITIRDAANAMVAATDGRSTVGRKARVIQLWLTRCLEDLERIDYDGGLW